MAHQTPPSYNVQYSINLQHCKIAGISVLHRSTSILPTRNRRLAFSRDGTEICFRKPPEKITKKIRQEVPVSLTAVKNISMIAAVALHLLD